MSTCTEAMLLLVLEYHRLRSVFFANSPGLTESDFAFPRASVDKFSRHYSGHVESPTDHSASVQGELVQIASQAIVQGIDTGTSQERDMSLRLLGAFGF